MENESNNTNAQQQDVRGEGRTREESHALSFINHWFYPYAMSAETHLAISPSKILLQGLFTTILERK